MSRNNQYFLKQKQILQNNISQKANELYIKIYLMDKMNLIIKYIYQKKMSLTLKFISE